MERTATAPVEVRVSEPVPEVLVVAVAPTGLEDFTFAAGDSAAAGGSMSIAVVAIVVEGEDFIRD